MRVNVNLEGNKNLVTIRSQTARKWLNELGYKYCHVGKNVFIDEYERTDMIEDRKHFLKVMEELELYFVKFDKTSQMILKIYLSDCEVGRDKRRLVIVMTNHEYTFLSNDGPCFGWQKDRDTFLQHKSKGQGIMVSEFLHAFGQLNLFFLSKLSIQDFVEKHRLIKIEAVEIFEFGKNN